MKKEIRENLLISVGLKKNAFGITSPVLWGYLPAEIEWTNGKKEKAFLVEFIELPPEGNLVKVLGKKFAKKIMAKEIQDKYSVELRDKLERQLTALNRHKRLNGKKIKSFKILSYEKWKKTPQLNIEEK